MDALARFLRTWMNGRRFIVSDAVAKLPKLSVVPRPMTPRSLRMYDWSRFWPVLATPPVPTLNVDRAKSSELVPYSTDVSVRV